MSNDKFLSIFSGQMEAIANNLHRYGIGQITFQIVEKCVLFFTIINGQIFWFCRLLTKFQ